MTWLLILVAVFYAIALMSLAERFEQIPTVQTEIASSHASSFSVVVPFRNERENLGALVNSLSKLNYPTDLVEFIFCNDHSSDGGEKELEVWLKSFPFAFAILHNDLSQEGKKAALAKGIAHAKMDFIVTTDADCWYPPEWLQSFDALLQAKDAEMIIGAVKYSGKDHTRFLDAYQVIENAGLVSIGAALLQMGKASMANGANLCFRRYTFMEVNGYEGNETIASGDDDFLLHKFHSKYPGKIFFVKNQQNIVGTNTQKNWTSFFHQRIRWAGKTKKLRNKLAYAIQIALAVFFFLWLWRFLFQPWSGGIWPVAVKVAADYYFYTRIRHFFSLDLPIHMILLVSLAQMALIPYIGISTLFAHYQWKDRDYHP